MCHMLTTSGNNLKVRITAGIIEIGLNWYQIALWFSIVLNKNIWRGWRIIFVHINYIWNNKTIIFSFLFLLSFSSKYLNYPRDLSVVSSSYFWRLFSFHSYIGKSILHNRLAHVSIFLTKFSSYIIFCLTFGKRISLYHFVFLFRCFISHTTEPF